jgi:hypothetical protein
MMMREGGGRGRRNGRIRSRFTESTANGTRLIGFAIGLVSMVLPWASVIRTENGFVQTVASYNLVDLLMLGDPATTWVLAAYVIGVAVALLYASSFVVVLVAWFLQDDIVRSYLMTTVPAAGPDVTYGVLFGLGAWLGLLVAFLLIVAVVAWFRGERQVPEGSVLPSELYPRGSGKGGVWGNVQWYVWLSGRRRNGPP